MMGTTITRSNDAASIVPELVLNEWESGDEPRTVIHEVLGREMPDVTLRPASSRGGTLRLLFADAAAAEAGRQFHRAAAVFTTISTLPWVPAAYVPAGPIRTTQQAGSRWLIEVPFREVAP